MLKLRAESKNAASTDGLTGGVNITTPLTARGAARRRVTIYKHETGAWASTVRGGVAGGEAVVSGRETGKMK